MNKPRPNIGETWEHKTFGEVRVTKEFKDCNGKPYWEAVKTRCDDHPFGATVQPVGTKVVCVDVSKFKSLTK